MVPSASFINKIYSECPIYSPSKPFDILYSIFIFFINIILQPLVKIIVSSKEPDDSVIFFVTYSETIEPSSYVSIELIVIFV
jgi:hypothetical protein